MALTSCSICLPVLNRIYTHPTCLFANYFSPCFHIKREQNKFKRKVHVCLRVRERKSRFNTIKNYRHAKYSLSNSLRKNLGKNFTSFFFPLSDLVWFKFKNIFWRCSRRLTFFEYLSMVWGEFPCESWIQLIE